MLGIKFNLQGPDNSIQLCQRKSAEDILNKYQMIDLKPSPIPVAPHLSHSSDMAPKDPQEIKEIETQPFGEMFGNLRYLVSCTRPDLCYITGYISRFMQNSGKPHLDALLQVFQYLKPPPYSDYPIRAKPIYKDGVMLTIIVIKIQDIQQQVMFLP